MQRYNECLKITYKILRIGFLLFLVIIFMYLQKHFIPNFIAERYVGKNIQSTLELLSEILLYSQKYEFS